MEFQDFPNPANLTGYDMSSADVLSYLHSYATHFKLTDHIKLSHVVTQVIPIENDRWEVHVTDAQINQNYTKDCDFVFVCNGKNSEPVMPIIKGMDKFKGIMIHSHDYRKPDPYKSKCDLENNQKDTDTLSKPFFYLYFKQTKRF